MKKLLPFLLLFGFGLQSSHVFGMDIKNDSGKRRKTVMVKLSDLPYDCAGVILTFLENGEAVKCRFVNKLFYKGFRKYCPMVVKKVGEFFKYLEARRSELSLYERYNNINPNEIAADFFSKLVFLPKEESEVEDCFNFLKDKRPSESALGFILSYKNCQKILNQKVQTVYLKFLEFCGAKITDEFKWLENLKVLALENPSSKTENWGRSLPKGLRYLKIKTKYSDIDYDEENPNRIGSIGHLTELIYFSFTDTFYHVKGSCVVDNETLKSLGPELRYLFIIFGDSYPEDSITKVGLESLPSKIKVVHFGCGNDGSILIEEESLLISLNKLKKLEKLHIWGPFEFKNPYTNDELKDFGKKLRVLEICVRDEIPVDMLKAIFCRCKSLESLVISMYNKLSSLDYYNQIKSALKFVLEDCDKGKSKLKKISFDFSESLCSYDYMLAFDNCMKTLFERFGYSSRIVRWEKEPFDIKMVFYTKKGTELEVGMYIEVPLPLDHLGSQIKPIDFFHSRL